MYSFYNSTQSGVIFIFLPLGKQVCAELLIGVFVDCQTVRLPRSRISRDSNAGWGERLSATRPDLRRGPLSLVLIRHRGSF